MQPTNSPWGMQQHHSLDNSQYDTTIMGASSSRRDSMSSDAGFTSSPASSTVSSHGYYSMPPTPDSTNYDAINQFRIQQQEQQQHFKPAYPMSSPASSIDLCLPQALSHQQYEWYLASNQAITTPRYSGFQTLAQMQRNVAELQYGQRNGDVPFSMSPPHRGFTHVNFNGCTSALDANSVPTHSIQPEDQLLTSIASTPETRMSVAHGLPVDSSPFEMEFNLFVDRYTPFNDECVHGHRVLAPTFQALNTTASWSSTPLAVKQATQLSWDVMEEARTSTTQATISPSLVFGDTLRNEKLSLQQLSALTIDSEVRSEPGESTKKLEVEREEKEAGEQQPPLKETKGKLHERKPRSNLKPRANFKQQCPQTREKNDLKSTSPSFDSLSKVESGKITKKRPNRTRNEETVMAKYNGQTIAAQKPIKQDLNRCEEIGCGKIFARREHFSRHKITLHDGGACLDCALKSFGVGFWCKISPCEDKYESASKADTHEAGGGETSEVRSEHTRGHNWHGTKPEAKKKNGISRHDNKIQHYVTHLKSTGRNKTCEPRFLELAERYYFGEEAAKHTMVLVYKDCERKINAKDSTFRIGKPDMKLQMEHDFWPKYSQAPPSFLPWETLYRLQDERDGIVVGNDANVKCKL